MNIEEQSFAGWFAKNLRNQPKEVLTLYFLDREKLYDWIQGVFEVRRSAYVEDHSGIVVLTEYSDDFADLVWESMFPTFAQWVTAAFKRYIPSDRLTSILQSERQFVALVRDAAEKYKELYLNDNPHGEIPEVDQEFLGEVRKLLHS